MTSAKQASARYTQEFKLEAVRWVKAGQAVVAAAKAPRISKASLSNRVRLAAKGKLDGGDVTGKPVKVTPEQMEICAPRRRVFVWSVTSQKEAAAFFAQDTLRGTPGYTK